VSPRFRKMHMLLMVSSDENFIVSDWPCFDIADSKSDPLLVSTSGNDANALCQFAVFEYALVGPLQSKGEFLRHFQLP
jgi:hypothetical protein